jgi:hypothetical protein
MFKLKKKEWYYFHDSGIVTIIIIISIIITMENASDWDREVELENKRSLFLMK